MSRERVTRLKHEPANHVRGSHAKITWTCQLKHLHFYKIKVPCTKPGTINFHLLIVDFTSYRFGKNKKMISSIARKHFQSCLLKTETIITHRINRVNLVLQGTFLVFHIELELPFLKKSSNTARNVAFKNILTSEKSWNRTKNWTDLGLASNSLMPWQSNKQNRPGINIVFCGPHGYLHKPTCCT